MKPITKFWPRFSLLLWLFFMFSTYFARLFYYSRTRSSPDTPNILVMAWLAIPLAVAALMIDWRLARREQLREDAEERRKREERDRKRELENKFYRENPERYVWEYCHACNMKIPAFAQICPYCRTNLREER
jgi:beta-lactamase regulating signal transducer with metallopeptidase domain